MERVNRIFTNNIFLGIIKDIEKAEETRIYCGHGIEHMFDVARICYIINLEENYGFEKEIVYAAAFLHDIGRLEEYNKNVPHDLASAGIADNILEASGFSFSERKIIVNAILGHRKKGGKSLLGDILYRGDKMSRKCFLCVAENSCYWSVQNKNFMISY